MDGRNSSRSPVAPASWLEQVRSLSSPIGYVHLAADQELAVKPRLPPPLLLSSPALRGGFVRPAARDRANSVGVQEADGGIQPWNEPAKCTGNTSQLEKTVEKNTHYCFWF
ncbi:hypothetical protein EYF80_033691 [Liparis tanakae]|uniref:Uncharacterized protein n=1 Tax=Liparis tanakae TaxID=230148 RepID=A0A4Z2GS31_9TELE|nr:hypothetical protein EYF80_033691 [Liparis tanakae]